METGTARFYDPVARGTIAMARQSSHPKPVGDSLAGKRIIVAGVSRAGAAPANAIFRRLRDCGHKVIAVNPNPSELEGQTCYPMFAPCPIRCTV